MQKHWERMRCHEQPQGPEEAESCWEAPGLGEPWGRPSTNCPSPQAPRGPRGLDPEAILPQPCAKPGGLGGGRPGRSPSALYPPPGLDMHFLGPSPGRPPRPRDRWRGSSGPLEGRDTEPRTRAFYDSGNQLCSGVLFTAQETQALLLGFAVVSGEGFMTESITPKHSSGTPTKIIKAGRRGEGAGCSRRGKIAGCW